MFEQVIKCICFNSVPSWIIAMFLTISQRPPNFRSISFSPPAIQLRQINAPIDKYFHAACSTRLPWASWRINPDIHSLHQMLGQMHIIVAKEYRMLANLWLTDKTYPFLNQCLTCLILRMGLTGDYDLKRTLRVG